MSKAAQGTTILTAMAPDGKVFDKWVVKAADYSEDANSETNFIMPTVKSCESDLQERTCHHLSLTTQVNGGHGTISASKPPTEGPPKRLLYSDDAMKSTLLL
ncbi:MAG: InlB B-repeat-containing protein [Butyricicoccus sp.]